MGNSINVPERVDPAPRSLPRQACRNAVAILETCRAQSDSMSLVRARAKPRGFRAMACLLLSVGATMMASEPAFGQSTSSVPLGLSDVIRIAVEGRSEGDAASARIRAGEARAIVVSALEDPMIAPTIDHKPFGMPGMDYSLAFEQRFPISHVRRHRRQSALAEVLRSRAEADQVRLGVGVEAANAFLMLHERRRTADLLRENLGFARDIVAAANVRYAGGSAPQSDVLRAEVEVAKLEASLKSSAGEISAAEAMLNASMGVEVDRPVPTLREAAVKGALPTWPVLQAMLPTLPRLRAGHAEIARSEAEVLIMRDMYKPMATVRTGPAYTMAEGAGFMLMVGLSVPIWRSKLRAGVREARAMKEMSEADLLAMTRMAEGEAAQALHELEAAGARQAALRDDVLPRALFAIEPALAAYASGRQPLVSVIEAVQTLWSVRAMLIEADLRVGRAWTRLGLAGGSFELIES